MLVSCADEKSVFFPDVPQASWGALSAHLCQTSDKKIDVLIFNSNSDCDFFYSRIKFFLDASQGNFRLKVLPIEYSHSLSDAATFDSVCERTGTLNALAEAGDFKAKTVVITSVEALFAPALEPIQTERIHIECGKEFPRENLIKLLLDYGYYNEVLCESPGQFAVRGGVIDVYPIASQYPVRIDFFGDEVEGIRIFNPDTQLADGKTSGVRIDKAPSVLASEDSKFTALDYIKTSAQWIFFEPLALWQKHSDYFLYPENAPTDVSKFGKIFLRSDDEIKALLAKVDDE